MFPVRFWTDKYWPTSFFPKVGATPTPPTPVTTTVNRMPYYADVLDVNREKISIPWQKYLQSLADSVSSPSLSLSSGQIFVGSAGGVATAVTMSGDVTISNTGATTITAGAVTDSKLRDSVALSVIGRSVNSTGSPADISTTSGSGLALRESAGVLGFGTIGNTAISDLAWSKITGTPTTLGGYGITDGVSTSRTISTTAPLTGGGDLSANRTFAITAANLAGTANQISLSASGTGVLLGSTNITLSLPQNIDTGASPTFTGETLSGLSGTGTRLVTATSTGALGNATTIAGNYTFSGTIAASNLSGTNTGDQTISLTGDVTGSGTGSFAATIANAAVTYAKFQNIAGLSVAGRASSSSGVGADITAGTDAFVLRRSGTSLGFGTIGDASISALAWSKLTGTPTTLGGYGITDAVASSRTISTTAPLTGGGDLSANRTFAITAANLAGTTNQISLSASGTGILLGSTNITLSLPQDIHTGASPTFTGETLSGLAGTGTRVVTATSTGVLGNATTISGVYTWSNNANFSSSVAVAGKINVNGAVDISPHFVNVLNGSITTSEGSLYSFGVGSPDVANNEYVQLRHSGTLGELYTSKSGTGTFRDMVVYTSDVERFRFVADGTLKAANLAGTGTRLVTSTSTGVLGNATTIAGNYTFSGSLETTSLLLDSGVTTLPTNDARGYIYLTTTGGSFPFTGDMIIHPPSNAIRDIIFYTGSTTPVKRMTIAGADGVVDFAKAIYFSNGGATQLSYYEEGSYTGSLTGVSGTVTGTIEFVRIGKIVYLNISANLSGTSNSTSMTITGAPTQLRPISATSGYQKIPAADNGNYVTDVDVTMGTDGTLTFKKGGTSSAFTNSGLKGVFFNTSMVYSLGT